MPNLKCERCGYFWYPRTPALPKVCPACKSRKWNEEKPNLEQARQAINKSLA